MRQCHHLTRCYRGDDLAGTTQPEVMIQRLVHDNPDGTFSRFLLFFPVIIFLYTGAHGHLNRVLYILVYPSTPAAPHRSTFPPVSPPAPLNTLPATPAAPHPHTHPPVSPPAPLSTLPATPAAPHPHTHPPVSQPSCGTRHLASDPSSPTPFHIPTCQPSRTTQHLAPHHIAKFAPRAQERERETPRRYPSATCAGGR